MIHIQVKDRDPRVLADLIASMQSLDEVGLLQAPQGEFLRQFIAQQVAERPSHNELETVNFKQLDDETDWTDV
jgi:hypothetical protein